MLVDDLGAPGNLARLVVLARFPWPVPTPRPSRRRSLLAVVNLASAVRSTIETRQALDGPFLVADDGALDLAQMLTSLHKGWAGGALPAAAFRAAALLRASYRRRRREANGRPRGAVSRGIASVTFAVAALLLCAAAAAAWRPRSATALGLAFLRSLAGLTTVAAAAYLAASLAWSPTPARGGAMAIQMIASAALVLAALAACVAAAPAGSARPRPALLGIGLAATALLLLVELYADGALRSALRHAVAAARADPRRGACDGRGHVGGRLRQPWSLARPVVVPAWGRRDPVRGCARAFGRGRARPRRGSLQELSGVLVRCPFQLGGPHARARRHPSDHAFSDGRIV